MSAANQFENDILDLVFAAATKAGLFQDATDGISVLWTSLHDANPDEAGTQETNEATYGGYARVSVARSTAGFVVTNNSVSPAAAISFPEATGGSTTVTHFGLGTASSGAGQLLVYGTVSPNIAVSTSVTPRLTTATAVTIDASWIATAVGTWLLFKMGVLSWVASLAAIQ
ncbi:MAG: hypothetical protein Q8P46_15075 [Hyphomicrobiales bacterium]|nr:hypothetical protein [Hyphomicrobiales bacterium]